MIKMNAQKNIGYRPTWAELDLNNLAYNFFQIKKLLSPKTKIMACVKADAYGHGLVEVSRKLVTYQVDYLGVASIDEGIKLREAKIKSPILVLGTVLKKDILPLISYNLTQTVFSEELVFALNNLGREKNKIINIHIKVDTGMGRQGVLFNEAEAFIKKIYPLKYIRIEGIFTHFPCADTNKNFTNYQIKIFRDLVLNLKNKGINIPLVHAANSIGIVDYPQSHFNMVRPGLILYGLYPKENLKINLKPVLSLKTKVVYVKKVPPRWGISYGHTYITKNPTNIVILPVGYGDGYPRNLSNLASVLIQGRRFKISGTICMDQMMVDVGNLSVKIGQEVVLIGSQGKNKVTAEELARLSGTIPYEIVCGLGSRIWRVYK